jgi:hypothetical protein
VLLVEAEPGAERSAAFLSVARFLEAQGLGPPRVLDVAAELGVVALEDLGNRSLRRALEEAGAAERRAWFAAAVDLLVELQTRASAALTPDVHAFHVRFDAATFRRELGVFLARCASELLGCPVSAGEGERIGEAFDRLAAELAAAPAVLTHRDYHIDNLFVAGGRVRLLDFQDARWGPASYDLASLLTDRDVHRFLAPREAQALRERLVARRGLDPARFASEYDRAVVQRSLKACGTFADQALRGRRHYLAFLAPSLGRARAAARRLTAFKHLARWLEGLEARARSVASRAQQ